MSREFVDNARVRARPTAALSNRATALLVTAVSLVAWIWWAEARTIHHPWADLSRGGWSDHFSHMNGARAFPRVGIELWRRGPKLLLPAVSPEGRTRLPPDLLSVGPEIFDSPGWPADKPWAQGWSFLPRFYPPGDLLLVAPVAALYEWTDLSFTGANKLMICLFLVYAHVGLFLALKLTLDHGRLQTPLMWCSLLLLYAELIHWSLEGFYDVAIVAPLLLCAMYLRDRRALAAAVAYCVAAFCHFRALFFGPLSLYAVWLFIEDEQWRRFRRRDWLAAAVMVPMVVATLGTLKMTHPSIASTYIDNPGYLPHYPIGSPVIATFLLVLAVAACAMIRASAWVELAVLLWMGAMFLTLRLAFTWHTVIPLAWLAMPVLRTPRGDEMVRGARLLMVTCAGVLMFRTPLWPTWIELLWR